MEHKLKILPQYFTAVKSGEKTFEIRKNDRGFKVGDTLLLREWNKRDLQRESNFTGQEITKEVSYILEGGQYGLEEGYCILGLKDIERLYARVEMIEQQGIILKNINLTGISKLEQGIKADEELKEFREAFKEYKDNKTKENKDHLLEEWWDRNQAELGVLEKEGITATEVMKAYSLHEAKVLKRPRIKMCSKCINRVKKINYYECTINDEMIYSDDYAKQCKHYKEEE